MKFHILTLFPQMVLQGLNTSIIGRAAEQGLIELNAVDIRAYTLDKHGKVDDYPYGGGAGMLMQAQPVFDAHQAVTCGRKVRTVYVTPQGRTFTQQMAEELAREEELVFLCGHYEGIDERVLEEVVTDYVSIGDYVLTGGELPAMVMIDAVSRLVPGVLHNEVSAETESFHNDLLEYPQYSRPEVWHGKQVPEVLLSGNHKNIVKWRLERSKERTAQRRPDLYEKYRKKCHVIEKLSRKKREYIHMMESLHRGNGELLAAEGQNSLVWDRKANCAYWKAETPETLDKMAAKLPPDAVQVVVNARDAAAREYVEERYCFQKAYRQFCYTRKETLPVKCKDISRLGEESLMYLLEHSGEEEHGEIRDRMRDGAFYGIFREGQLRGFIGLKPDSSMGYLFVEEDFRRQGLGASLEAYLINRQLEWGWTPFIQVEIGQEAVGKLQEKLGLYESGNEILQYRR